MHNKTKPKQYAEQGYTSAVLGDLSEYFENGLFVKTTEGSLQGGLLSPLLANEGEEPDTTGNTPMAGKGGE